MMPSFSAAAGLLVLLADYLIQYANSPGHKVYCYAAPIISSLIVAITIASTPFA